MTDRIAKGIDLLADVPGSGPPAARGSRVTYSARLFLKCGDEVTTDAESVARYGAALETRTIDDVTLIEHTTTLGKRRTIAGIERSLHGMCAGGYREVMIAPHLGYGAAGVEGHIPANAMLRIRLWVHRVAPDTDPPSRRKRSLPT